MKKKLDKPELPQADEKGIIDVSKTQDDDLIIFVPPYGDLASKDTITAYAGDIASKPFQVEDPHKPVYLYIPFTSLPDGEYNVCYIAVDGGGNQSTSDSSFVIIKNSPSLKYQPPYYPDARDGVVSYQPIKDFDGLRVHIYYNDIKIHDEVVFCWSGFDSSGNEIDSAYWKSESIVVSDTDIQNGYVELTVPVSSVLCLGESGLGSGYYIVNNSYNSVAGTVYLTLADISPALLLLSSEAPPIDNVAHPEVYPSNLVKVFGPPGKKMVAYVDYGTFVESGKGDYYFQPNDKGEATFHIQSDKAGTVSCEVTVDDGTMDIARGRTTFDKWNEGSNGISYYAKTTGIPADGRSASSVYVIIDRKIYTGRTITVKTYGSAVIEGFNGHQADVVVSTDGYATFGITNTVAEKNEVTLTVPGHGNSISLFISFEAFP